MNSWEDQLDWREVLLGSLVGIVVGFLAGFVMGNIFLILLSDLLQAVITYVPAGFWAAYRARRGHPLVNAMAAGAILFIISSLVFALAGGLVFPTPTQWLIQAAIIAVIVLISGAVAQILRQEAP